MGVHRRKRSKTAASGGPAGAAGETLPLRIIGGVLGGRKLAYSGLDRTRPMKDRVREAVFNLVGPAVKGTHAIDLFAGTGALGLEAISRGAARATFTEQHFPSARLIEQNALALGVADRCEVVPGDAFAWVQRREELSSGPWVVFCSPPFAFYIERGEAMVAMLGELATRAPEGSTLVAEADGRFDFSTLIEPDRWDIRSYPPAVIGILRKN